MLIPVLPDVKTAQAKLDAWAKEVEAQRGIKINVDGLAAKQQLADIDAAAKKLKGTSDGVFQIAKMQQYGAALGAVKGIFDQVNASVGLLSENQNKAVDRTLSLTQQGVALGAAFGPWGALIGGAAGAVTGIGLGLWDWHKASQATLPLVEDMEKAYAKIKGHVKEAANYALQWLNTLADQQKAYEKIDAFLINGPAKDTTPKTAAAAKKAYDDALIAIAQLRMAENVTDKESQELTDKAQKAYDLWQSMIQKTTTATQAHTAAIKDQIGYIAVWDRERMAAEERALAAGPGLTRRANGKQSGAISGDAYYGPQEEAAKLRAQEEKTAAEHAAALAKIEEDAYNKRVATIDGYLSQVTSLTGAVASLIEKNISAGAKAFDGLGAAAEAGVAQVLKALAKEWGTKSIAEFAAAAATFGTPMSAKHVTAGIGYGAAALIAGGLGAGVAGDATKRQNENAGGGSTTSSTSTTPAVGGTTQAPGPTTLPPIIIYQGGAPGSTTIHTGTGEEAKARAGRWAEDILEAARRGGPRLGGGR